MSEIKIIKGEATIEEIAAIEKASSDVAGFPTFLPSNSSVESAPITN